MPLLSSISTIRPATIWMALFRASSGLSYGYHFSGRITIPDSARTDQENHGKWQSKRVYLYIGETSCGHNKIDPLVTDSAFESVACLGCYLLACLVSYSFGFLAQLSYFRRYCSYRCCSLHCTPFTSQFLLVCPTTEREIDPDYVFPEEANFDANRVRPK